MRIRLRLVAVAAVLVFLWPGDWAAARNYNPEFDFGFGYAQLDLRGDRQLDGSSAAGVRLGISFTPLEDQEAFRMGIGLSLSRYDEEERLPFDPEPELFDLVGTFSELDLISPELRLSWRHSADRFFIEPGVGFNLLIGNYTAGETRLGLFGRFDDVLVRRTRVGFGLRPGIRAGYEFDPVSVGIEGSYMFGRLRLGEGVGGSLREWYAGGFIAWRF